MPVFTELQEQGRHKEAQRLVGGLIGLITMGLGLVTLIAIVTAPWVMPLFAPGLPEDLVDETVQLAQIMFPIVVLLGLTGLVAAVLQAHGEFGATAFVPVLWNVVIIVGLIVAVPLVPEDDRITVYAVAIVIGTIAQLLWLLPSLRGKGPFPISLGLAQPARAPGARADAPGDARPGADQREPLGGRDLRDPGQRRVAAGHRRRLPALPAAPGGLQRRDRDRAVPDHLAPGGPGRHRAGMRRTLAEGLRQIFFMLLPASAFLLVLAEPVVRLVFQRGEFDAASTSLTSEALVFFSIGLAFNGASLLVIRAFFSLQRPWLPTEVAGARGGAERRPRRDPLPAPRAPAASRWRPRSRAS